jgi:hypothetical protein
MKPKLASLIGRRKVLEYVEWEKAQEQPQSITEVLFLRDGVSLVWSAGELRTAGTATTTDGKHFEGRWKGIPPVPDQGGMSFTLFRAADGEALLVGKWFKEGGDQSHFFLRVSPEFVPPSPLSPLPSASPKQNHSVSPAPPA